MASAKPSPVLEGEVLDGKYRVDRILGAGGMGVVVAATHVQLQTRVALKFLLPEVLGSPQIVDRFLREARAAVRIQSEHVARVLDVGTLADGAPYMVMEYLEGRDLSELLATRQTLPIERCVGYVLEACEAIAEAHSLGIVHRDLKPANLYLANRPGRQAIVKVLDFGISKSMDAASAGLTKTSAVMGSPCYMSPEQMRSSKDVDARSDIWALGVILYELVTGALPFPGESLPEIVCQVTQGEMRPIRDLRPDVPDGLAEAIGRCLQRDPGRRYANVAELARSLADFAPAEGAVFLDRICRILEAGEAAAPRARAPHARRGAQDDSSLIHAAVSDGATSGVSLRPGLRRRIFIALGAALAVGAAVVAWQVAKGRQPPAPVRAASPTPAAATTPSAFVRPEPPAAPAPAEPLPSAVPPPPPASQAVPDAAAPVRAVERAKPTPPAAPARRLAAPVRKREPAAPPAPVNRGLNMGLKE
jgi:serine/threonine-protein kinase